MRYWIQISILSVIAICMTWTNSVQSQESASDYFEDARIKYVEGELEAAIIQLKNALQQDDQHVPSLVLFGDIHQYMGIAPVADTAYGEALLLGGDVNYITPRLAESYFAQQKLNELLDQLDPEQLTGRGKADLLGYQALALLQLKRINAGREKLGQALQVDRKALVPNLAATRYALQEGNLTRANQISAQFVSNHPDSPVAWFIRGTALNAIGESAEAVLAFRNATGLNPYLASARLALASLYLSEGNLEKASSEIKVVRKKNPGVPGGVFLQAQLYDSRGEIDKAREAYVECANMLSQADPEFLASELQLTYMAAISHMRADEPERAITALRAFNSRNQNHQNVGQFLATLLLTQGRASEALEVLKPLLVIEWDDPVLLVLQARALRAMGRHAQAISVWHSLMGKDLDVDASAQIAINQLLSGDTQSSLEQLETLIKEDSKRIEERYLLATTYLRRGVTARAVDLANELVQLDPQEPHFRVLLGKSLMFSGDLDGARVTLENALDSHPEFLPLGLTLAEVHTLAGDLAGAAKQLDLLIEQRDGNAEVILQRARIHRLSGDLEQARKWAEQSISAAPKWLLPRQFLVQVLLELEETILAEQLARSSAAQDSNNSDARLLLAKTLVALNKSREARSVYQLMARRFMVDANLLYRVSREQRNLGAFSDAKGTLALALSSKPDSLRYREAFIQVETSLENFDNALKLADDLARDFPDSEVPHSLRADVFLQQGKAQAALKEYRLAARSRPDDRALLVSQFRALSAAGSDAEAEQLLDDWLKRAPNDVIASYAMSEFLIDTGRWAEASEVLKNLNKMQPDNPLILNNLAYVLGEMGDEQALILAQQAHQLSPETPAINDTLGWILVKNQKVEQSLSYLREAVTRQSQDPTFRYHLAIALNKLGRHREAYREINVALTLPDHDDLEWSDSARELQRQLSDKLK